MKLLAFAFADFIALGASAQAGGVITPAENRYSAYSGVVPACDDPGVLSKISDRFAGKESEYWDSALQISGYAAIRESGFRANGLAYIPRRYCMARAMLSDARPRAVIYQVQE